METYLCIDTEVLEHVSLFALRREYEALLTRLYQRDLDITSIELHERLHAQTEILVFLIHEQQLVATAQGSIVQALPQPLMVVSNVVTHDDYEGQGFGRQVMAALEAEGVMRWASTTRPLRAILTNRPTRGNSAFYQAQGWYPLTPDTDTMTRLWQKDL